MSFRRFRKRLRITTRCSDCSVKEKTMTKIQTQGVHHITFVGSNREATIDFYQGVLGMPLVFVRPTRVNDPAPNPQNIGNLHHIAFTVSRATYTQVAKRLQELGIENTGP